MNKNFTDKDFLYDIIDGFEDELIEKAADYNKSSKILPFPIYKYVNAVAAFLICIILTVVFVQLKPINEINETLIIPTTQPKITATPDITDEPEETVSPVETEKPDNTQTPKSSDIPDATERPDNMPFATELPDSVKDFDNKYDSNILVPPISSSDATEKPSVTLKPGRLPVATEKPTQTKKPDIIVEPSEEPEFTKEPMATEIPTKAPVITERPTAVPVITVEPTDTPVITLEPTDMPVITPKPTDAPVITSKPTDAPVITPKPTFPPALTPMPAPPGKTPKPTEVPIITTEPTLRPTVIPMPTEPPYMGSSQPTCTPEPPMGTSGPTCTPEPPMGTGVPTPSPTPMVTAPPRVTATPTPEPTAPPLDIEDCTSVEGNSVVIKDLNGATYDADKEIIEFTEKSVDNRLGVEIINPIAGNVNMISDYGYLMDVDTGGLLNAFHLAGSKLGWGTDGEKLPVPKEQLESGISQGSMDVRIRIIKYADQNRIYYPKPESKSGFSISYWANTTGKKESGPAVTFVNSSQCIVVTINGNVNYVDNDDSLNCFSADSNDYCNPGEWHYYTITFANDWITYYVDGIEIPYLNVQLKSSYIGTFNDGFLTRYNPVIAWSKETYSNDWRGYVKGQCFVEEDSITTLGVFSVLGIGRYYGGNRTGKLLLNFMSSSDTRVLLGGGNLGYNYSIAGYYNNNGTRFAQVRYYNVELTNKNVYANYHEALKSKPD